MVSPTASSRFPHTRRTPRALVCARALVMTERGPSSEHMTHDLSAGGVRLCGLPYVQVGDDVTVRLFLPRGSCNALARVLRVDSTLAKPQVAIEFLELSPRAEDVIHDSVVDALSHPKRRSVLLLGEEDRGPVGGDWFLPIWPICSRAPTPVAALQGLKEHSIEVGILSQEARSCPWSEVVPSVVWRTVGLSGRLELPRFGGQLSAVHT